MCLVELPLVRADTFPGGAFHGVLALDEVTGLAVGDDGLLVRFNADEVTQIDAATDADLHAVIRTSHVIVVGAGGTVLRSTDGTAWAPVDGGVIADLHDVARTSERYEETGDGAHLVAVGEDVVLVGDLDGASWAPVTGDRAPGPLRKVVATSGGFLAFSATGTAIAIDPVAASFVTSPDTLSAAPISVSAVHDIARLYLADGTYWWGRERDALWRFEAIDPEYSCAGQVRILADYTELCIDEGTYDGIPLPLDHFAAMTDLGEEFLVVVGDDGSLRLHQRVLTERCQK